jgi:predicted dehydrogenase
MERKVNWGIIGTGGIAKTFARALSASKTGWLVAVGSRSQAPADAFANLFNIGRSHGNYDALLNDADVQAVYIATPHPMHMEWAIKAARAGKHVLVEKPLAINAADAKAMIDAAAAKNLFFMEAFMYRCHPQTARLVEILREKQIGEVRVIRASLSFQASFDAKSRLFDPALGGGGILDVGCYPASMARLIAGVAMGKDFADPIEIYGAGHLGKTGVDEWAMATLKFPGDIIAQLSSGISVNQENIVRIFGSAGSILIQNPWMIDGANAEQGKIVLQRSDGETREIIVEAASTAFTYEADIAGDAILHGKTQAKAPAMSWNDSLGNMKTLDAWRKAIGLVYPTENRRR